MSSSPLALVLDAARAADRAGDAARAIQLYEQIAKAEPGHVVAWSRLGALHTALGSVERGLLAFEAAAAAAPAHPAVQFNLGRALATAGQTDAAVQAYRRALNLKPDYRDAYLAWLAAASTSPAEELLEVCERAIAAGCRDVLIEIARAEQLGRLEQKEDALAAALDATRLSPSNARAHFAYGNALHALGRDNDAILAFDRAYQLDPQFLVARVNCAVSQWALGRYESALKTASEVIELDEKLAIAHKVKGLCYIQLRDYDEAVTALRRSVELDANDLEAFEGLAHAFSAVHLNLNTLECLRYLDEQFEARKASTADRLRILVHWLDQLIDLARFVEARDCAARVRALDPSVPSLLGREILIASYLTDWPQIDALRPQLLEGCRVGEPVTSPFTLLSLIDDPILHREYTRANVSSAFEAAPPQRVARSSAGRLRIGYLSPDFRDHPVGRLVLPLFRNHDRENFEIHALSTWWEPKTPTDASPITTSIRTSCDSFTQLAALSDADAVAEIRRLGIDILVDLTGHTAGARPGILAARAAPIQVNYLGYPGTYGADFVEFIISDSNVIPPEFEACYTERVVRVARLALPPGERPVLAPTRGDRSVNGLPEEAIVLGAFHSTYKISAEMFAVWMRLLARHPDTVLWMSTHDESTRDALKKHAANAGLDPSRVLFADREPNLVAHLERLRQVDLMLDTFPYGSHSAAMDTLWAGVPILTRRGQSFASRVCAGLLNVAGLPDLIADDAATYEAIATRLISEPSALSNLRTRVEALRDHSLFDATAHARDLEDAFRSMLDAPPAP